MFLVIRISGLLIERIRNAGQVAVSVVRIFCGLAGAVGACDQVTGGIVLQLVLPALGVGNDNRLTASVVFVGGDSTIRCGFLEQVAFVIIFKGGVAQIVTDLDWQVEIIMIADLEAGAVEVFDQTFGAMRFTYCALRPCVPRIQDTKKAMQEYLYSNIHSWLLLKVALRREVLLLSTVYLSDL